MANKHVRVDDEQYQALQELSKANGVPIAEQVRRAVRAYTDRGTWETERSAVIKFLRGVCKEHEEHGVNEWPDDLHVVDILDKYLLRFYERID